MNIHIPESESETSKTTSPGMPRMEVLSIVPATANSRRASKYDEVSLQPLTGSRVYRPPYANMST